MYKFGGKFEIITRPKPVLQYSCFIDGFHFFLLKLFPRIVDELFELTVFQLALSQHMLGVLLMVIFLVGARHLQHKLCIRIAAKFVQLNEPSTRTVYVLTSKFCNAFVVHEGHAA
uniref:Uncharacterized protein n=1 Tax=Anopheles culicifacies TaxID=139723 RepID=A0A182MN51_9DIPT